MGWVRLVNCYMISEINLCKSEPTLPYHMVRTHQKDRPAHDIGARKNILHQLSMVKYTRLGQSSIIKLAFDWVRPIGFYNIQCELSFCWVLNQ